MSRAFRCAILVGALNGAFPASGTCALLINEVLYDPEGPDSGREFVELTNTGAYSAPLEGVTLEMGNGSRPSDWKTIWTAPAGDWLEPGGYYAVGVAGPWDGDSTRISIQNGPDGVRITRSGFVLDRVGWGNLAYREYAEGEPCPPARAGKSLARWEDGVDTDDNAADFREAVPSPGRANRPKEDWAIRILSMDPERPRPGEQTLLRLRWSNLGCGEARPPAADLLSDAAAVEVRADRVTAPGGTIVQPVVLPLPDREGRGVVRCALRAADEIPENDRDSLLYRAGPGPVRILEIMADPGAGGSEWIEVSVDRARIDSGGELSLEGGELSLEIRGRSLRLPPRAAILRRGIALIAEDSTMVRGRFPDLPEGIFWPYEGSWTKLRNDDGGHGISDSLRLRGPDGAVEEIALPGRSPAPGVSLERLEGDLPEGPAAWTPCAEREGATPGRASLHLSAASADGGSILSIDPPHLRVGSTTCRIEGRLGIAAARCDLSMVDLSGRTIRCLLRDVWVSGMLLATWDGRDEADRAVPPGVYVAHLSVARSGGGAEHHRAAVAVSE